mmetsp:Transcript_76664/g.211783  ORF Transcript_76664/g.211783 Transcript_76664/m.211783 type:complete len:84 (-) Transcript_76664:143-394(-)|eukprot:CAMPEP_0179078522 /NCGR_PEP_ID=MMETSP0796-20121207/35171_1 /TAXON_ID=73915 /ORGANISM="Pyrodinium bahamense, Strain pbaha01" /LENGTH=83 /DNA_ID=CAMNT_0020775831 /DNA_START=12 /DNA_END=263 /DNA_ORIENTATION=+
MVVRRGSNPQTTEIEYSSMPVKYFTSEKVLSINVELPGGAKGVLMPGHVLSELYTQRLQGRLEEYGPDQAQALKKKAAGEKKK